MGQLLDEWQQVYTCGSDESAGAPKTYFVTGECGPFGARGPNELRASEPSTSPVANPGAPGASNPLGALKFFATALEDSPLTNAGKGSELNQRGEIECDACVATSPKTHHAAVSSVQNVKNPVLLCTEMLKDKEAHSLSAPRFLTAQGAYEYACLKNLETGSLETKRARDAFEYWTTKGHAITDTIGVIALDADSWAVASSSGGSLLKFPGRVGPAAVYGAAADISKGSASVCSGFGEDILEVSLARQANMVENLEDLLHVMSEYDLQRDPYFGVIRAQKSGSMVYVDYFHTTEAMNFAVLDSRTGKRHIYTGNRSGASSGGGFKFDLAA